MSTAAKFATLSPFPFCPKDISGDMIGFDYVSNLTLAQAMAFFWNVETFTVSRTGTASRGALTVDVSGTLTFNAVSDTFYDRGGGNGPWIGDVSLNTYWADWPATRDPRGRVCSASALGTVININLQKTSAAFGFFQLYIGTDPSNSGKYRIYYRFFMTDLEGGGPYTGMTFVNPTYGASGTFITSGTFAIGGYNFSYDSYYQGTSYTGGTMSSTSSDYTY